MYGRGVVVSPQGTETNLSVSPTLKVIQGASLSLTPENQNLATNTVGSLGFFVNPSEERVASMELVIDYNPDFIRVDDIAPGAFFTDYAGGAPIEITKTIDNSIGRIHYALGFPLGSDYSSVNSGTAAEVTFKALKSGTSQLSFVTNGNPSTKVADINAENVLGSTNNATVVIE
jgi:hypothetical protein